MNSKGVGQPAHLSILYSAVVTLLIALYLLVATFLIHDNLLITFTNSLDPDQAQQNVGPDLDLTV